MLKNTHKIRYNAELDTIEDLKFDLRTKAHNQKSKSTHFIECVVQSLNFCAKPQKECVGFIFVIKHSVRNIQF